MNQTSTIGKKIRDWRNLNKYKNERVKNNAISRSCYLYDLSSWKFYFEGTCSHKCLYLSLYMSSIEFSSVMHTIFFVDLCRYIRTSVDFIAIPFFLQVAHLTPQSPKTNRIEFLEEKTESNRIESRI